MWIMALAFSSCAMVSLYYYKNPLEADAMQCWICLISLSIMAAIALYIPSRNATNKLFRKEAMCIIGIAWILTSAIGSLPYLIILDCPLAAAFFESTSGFTTTGASVFSSFSNFPPSLMFWRCLTHWIGGLGVVVFFVAILSFLGASGRILYSNEASVDSGDFESARIRNVVMSIVVVYLVLSALCYGSLRIFGMGNFDSVCHMFSIVSTGGFSSRESGIYGYNYGVYWSAIIFMFLGGTNFALLIAAAKLEFKKILNNTEFWTYVLIAAASAIIITVILQYSMDRSFLENLTFGTFEVISTMTTTGLYCDNTQPWLPSAQNILMVISIVGASAGSTAGGLKIYRAVAAFRICKREIEKSFRPRVVRNVFLNGKVLGDSDANDVLSYIVLYSLIVSISVVCLSLLEPKLSTMGCLSSVFAAINNLGRGFAEVGCNSSYAVLSDPAQFMLSILMIIGRLEIYALLVLFMPSLWKKFQ